MKILRFIGILYFMACLVGGAFVAFFYIQEEMHQNPFKSGFKIHDCSLGGRPHCQIYLAGIADAEYKAVSYAQYSQKTLVNYMLGKTFLSAFSWFNSCS
jgi:hypothetical protein